ncbi:MAG: hypothetical protein K6G15_06460 [Desulfovibrio sp.]|nr:hypothetical protein [Desulfovibrio sp.]
MRGLLKRLAPFAPDSSGVVSALYELEGLLVICDAGGCTGNYCGFDEPRWKEKKCALFSAGLRDMDAILGRDDRLVEKAVAAAKLINPRFLAIIGTPVPCVIATDFTGLGRLAEKKLGLPTLTFATTGTKLYDEGLSLAYTRLFDLFAQKEQAVVSGRIGVLGASPLDLGESSAHHLRQNLQNAQNAPSEILSHGLDCGFQALSEAASCERNLVIAPSGLACAKLLQERFGTPYTLDYPLSPGLQALAKEAAHYSRIAIIHQQVLACALRRALYAYAKPQKPEVTVASFFTLLEELSETGDQHLETEDALRGLIEEHEIECLVGDAMFVRALSQSLSSKLRVLELPHFAVSGSLMPQGLC